MGTHGLRRLALVGALLQGVAACQAAPTPSSSPRDAAADALQADGRRSTLDSGRAVDAVRSTDGARLADGARDATTLDGALPIDAGRTEASGPRPDALRIRDAGLDASSVAGDGASDAVAGDGSPASVSRATVAAGDYHSCALTRAGGVACWGSNGYHQLGAVRTGDYYTPQVVAGLGGTPVAVAVGDRHSCALLQGGQVSCWGDNSKSQLGRSLSPQSSSLQPGPVAGLGSGVSAIALGRLFGCALKAGRVYCWGAGPLGRSGVNTSLAPLEVKGLRVPVQAIGAGGDHACAIEANGSVKCWGNNDAGQLGTGDSVKSATPRPVLGLSRARLLSLGPALSCAADSGGLAYCWGGTSGTPGTGASWGKYFIPRQLAGMSRVTSIAAGRGHVCAVTATGLLCGGTNRHGELGIDDLSVKYLAAAKPVVGLSSTAREVAAATDHSCARLSSGALQCWGEGRELGIGDTENLVRPTPVTGISAIAVAAGDEFSCVVDSGGKLRCAGSNQVGELGSGTLGLGAHRHTRVPTGLDSGVSSVALGSDHGCAVKSGGVWCWGRGTSGQLGDGTTGFSTKPVAAIGLGSGIIAVAAGLSVSLALDSSGALWSWGKGDFGALGHGDLVSKSTPQKSATLDSGVSGMATSGNHSCAIRSGALYCWGVNNYGQLGDSSWGSTVSSPRVVPGMQSGVTAVATEKISTCAVRSGGVICWGYNYGGRLGTGKSGTILPPTPIPSLASGVRLLSAGDQHYCAATSSDVSCWGVAGPWIGDGTVGGGGSVATSPRSTGLTNVAQLIAGPSQSFAVSTTGAVRAWGRNPQGNLGLGFGTNAYSPQTVKGL